MIDQAVRSLSQLMLERADEIELHDPLLAHDLRIWAACQRAGISPDEQFRDPLKFTLAVTEIAGEC